jgi:hypothetical protein
MESRIAESCDTATVSVTWSSRFAYAVGLLATDGFLTTRNTVGFSSTDLELVQNLFLCLDKPVSYITLTPEQQTGNPKLGITPKSDLHMVRITDALLYQHLLALGVKTRKSLTLGALAVPDEFLFDVVRGLMDGDGSVMALVAAPKGLKHPYRLTRLRLAFYSGSRSHLEWLRARLGYFSLRGSIHAVTREGHTLYHLIYSDRQAATILSTAYEDPRAPRLTRKWQIWEQLRQLRGWPPYYASV